MTHLHPRQPALLFCLLFQVGCFNSGHTNGPDDAGGTGDARGFDASLPDAAGPDTGWRDTGTVRDAGSGFDAGAPSECTADDIRVIECPMFLCDAPAQWYWNGHSCFPVECGACEGDDCGSGHSAREECEVAHRTCESTLCRQSGGTWRFWGVSDCGFVCGQPSGDDCIDGPTCDCGARATFVEGRGCVEMDSCIPPPIFISPQEYCEMSGGEWGGFCAHSHCGQYSPLACVQPACHCPWPQVFAEGRGCVDGEACFRGDGGCDERSICPTGTSCVDGTCEFAVCPFVDG